MTSAVSLHRDAAVEQSQSRDLKVRAVIKYSSYSIHCIIKNVFFNFSHNILKVLPKLRLI